MTIDVYKLLMPIIWVEKRFFFTFGILLPLLKSYWKEEGRKIQRELDRQIKPANDYE